MEKNVFSRLELEQLSMKNLRNLAKYYGVKYTTKDDLIDKLYGTLMVSVPDNIPSDEPQVMSARVKRIYEQMNGKENV